VHEDLLSPVAVPAGDPGRISAVASADLDLLVCGSRGYGPVRSVILASVLRELARFGCLLLLGAPRPARQERDRAAAQPRRIVARPQGELTASLVRSRRAASGLPGVWPGLRVEQYDETVVVLAAGGAALEVGTHARDRGVGLAP
jgi:hypothetical protein